MIGKFFNRLVMLILVSAIAGFSNQQKKILPIYFSLLENGSFEKELTLNFKAAFANNNINTISKEDLGIYIKNEGENMMAGYLQNGGNVTDIEKIKNYSSTHMHKIANSLVISIKVNNDGLIGDTVKWDNHTVPIDMLNPPKTGFLVGAVIFNYGRRFGIRVLWSRRYRQ